jgi:hypothetical protein
MLSNQVIALCSTQRYSRTSRGFSYVHGCEFRMLAVPSSINWARPWTACHAKCVSVVAAIHKMVHGCHDHSVRSVVLFRGDAGDNHHCAKFSIPVSLLHQSSWKFCVYLYLGLAAQLPNIIFSTPSLFTVCTREGTSVPQSTECVLKCFAMWNSAKWIPLPVFRHSNPTILIAETVHDMPVGVFFICTCVWHFHYDWSETQHSHTIP